MLCRSVHVSHRAPVSLSLNDGALVLLEQERVDAVRFDGTWQIVGFLITIFRCVSITAGLHLLQPHG